MPKKQPDLAPRRKRRTVPPEAAAAFEARQEGEYAKRTRPRHGDVAVSQGPGAASLQSHEAGAQPRETASLQDGTSATPRSSSRARGGWTKASPYVRSDGTATRATTVYLPVTLADRLRRFAFEADRKQSDVIAEAIELFLRDREGR